MIKSINFSSYISYNKKIIDICCDNEYIYILYEDNNSKKNILKLKEKENKDKFEIFYSKNQYETALTYAENSGFEKEKISEIRRKYAEYEYSKGDFDKAILQYIKTINYLEPSLVIQKFLEKSKLDYLIQYLEALENNREFQIYPCFLSLLILIYFFYNYYLRIIYKYIHYRNRYRLFFCYLKYMK